MAAVNDKDFVIVSDNTVKVRHLSDKAMKLGAELIGQRAEGYAKMDCPVDTGNLRNSITYAVDDDAIYIGTRVEYAAAVEFNDNAHHTVGKAHYLRDAASTHGDEYKHILKTVMQAID